MLKLDTRSGLGAATWKKAAALPACLLVATFFAVGAVAQDTPDDIEEIVVTGSLIKGTPIDAESPVTILERDGLEKQGLPSVVEMVRRVSASSGVEGETNQFTSGASEGVANINLRGLGAQRTLVLINGRRQVPVPQRVAAGRFVDINNMPGIAVQRIEVLKEGAAATYGSDAIGGVVNFLTRDDFTGIELAASHQAIKDSDGDQSIGIIAGHDFGNWNLVSSIGYQRRNELRIRDRDFTNRRYEENAVGGWSGIGNPGVFFNRAALASVASPFSALSPSAGGVKDPNCNAAGGYDQSVFCRLRYTDVDNLIEDEERLQWFTEVNGEFNEGINFHGEFLYATIDVPNWATSPSYPPQALFGDVQHTPANHPGLLNMAQQTYHEYNYESNCVRAPTGGCVTPGDRSGIGDRYAAFDAFIYADPTDSNRVSGSGPGATFYGRLVGAAAPQARISSRKYDTWRLAFALDGELESGIGWDFGFSYSSSKSEVGGVDAEIGRTKLAFNGYGGDECPATIDPDTGDIVENGATRSDDIATASTTGCYWYNPYSNAIRTTRAVVSGLPHGVQNPNYEESMANSPEVLDYLDDESFVESTADFMVADLLFQGEMFGGGAAWAFGYQYRYLALETENSEISNLGINPCRFRGQTDEDCPDSRTGLRSFLAGADDVDDSQDVHAFFFELALNTSEDMDVQLGARYEDYGQSTTFDPKLALRYTVNDYLALRGSVQSTFRGPDIDALSNASVTALSYVATVQAFKANDVVGNPDLQPEEAFTYNFGMILNPIPDLTLTVDYWYYDFDNPIIVESHGTLAAAFANPATKAAVQDQIYCTGADAEGNAVTVNDGSCPASSIERIITMNINGPSIRTSGIDLFADYSRDLGPGIFSVGLDVSHVLETQVDAWIKNGVQLQAPYDAVGRMNRSLGDNRAFPKPLPEFKGRVFFEYAWNTSNFLLYVNYITSYKDERYPGDAATPIAIEEIDDQTTFDLHYRLSMMDDQLLLTLSAINFTDEDPPPAGTDLNYDPYTHNAFGSMLKLGVQYRFGAF